MKCISLLISTVIVIGWTTSSCGQDAGPNTSIVDTETASDTTSNKDTLGGTDSIETDTDTQDTDSNTDSNDTATTDPDTEDTALPAHCSEIPSNPETACREWIDCCGWGTDWSADNYWSNATDCEARRLISSWDYYDDPEHVANCRNIIQVVTCSGLGTDAAQCQCTTVTPGECTPTTNEPALACTAAYECCNFFSPWLDETDFDMGGILTVNADSCEWDIAAGGAMWNAIECTGLGSDSPTCWCINSPNCD